MLAFVAVGLVIQAPVPQQRRGALEQANGSQLSLRKWEEQGLTAPKEYQGCFQQLGSLGVFNSLEYINEKLCTSMCVISLKQLLHGSVWGMELF